MEKDAFKKSLKDLNIELNDVQIESFDEYYRILVEWNKVMNLTAITDYDEVLLKHYIDSLAINKAIDVESNWNLNKKIKVIDIGTGAGFPGIPLKIIFDNLDVVLLDSMNKKVKFLNEVILKLNLSNMSAIHGRAEDFAKDFSYRESFDLCVSRAVSNLATLSEYCLPYVKVGGAFISYKSGEIDAELKDSEKAIQMLGGKILKVEKMTLPGSDIERSFVIIEKVKKTISIYPRKAGLPAKEPLK